MNITNIIYWLFENFTNFNSITTFLLGVATLIVTIVTARFIGQQTKVNKALFHQLFRISGDRRNNYAPWQCHIPRQP